MEFSPKPSDDHDLLLNINSKLNNFVEIYDQHRSHVNKNHDDHENRIRNMETAFYEWRGSIKLWGFLSIFFLSVLQVVLKLWIK